jgi:DNA polymerase-4
MDKPDGLYIIRPEQVEPFLRTLPVGRIPGVGKRAAETLAAYGVEFAADVLRHPPAFWERHLGRMGLALCDRARGIDPSGVTPETEIKSCSAENTFDKDLLDREALSRWLLRQADRVAADLRRHGKAGRTVTIKLKFNDFKQITRSHTLPDPVNDTRSIHRAALELLGKVTLHRPLRLIGVGVSGFGQRERSLSLLDERSPRKDAGLESAVDEVRRRFGGAAVRRASLKDFDCIFCPLRAAPAYCGPPPPIFAHLCQGLATARARGYARGAAPRMPGGRKPPRRVPCIPRTRPSSATVLCSRPTTTR